MLTVDPKYYFDEPLDNNLLQQNKALEALKIFRTRLIPGADKMIAFIRGDHRKYEQEKMEAEKRVPEKGSKVEGNTRTVTTWQSIKDAITLSLMIPDKQNGWLPFALL